MEHQFTCIWDIGGAHDASDLLHGLEVGREAAMATEDLLINDSCDGQAVEAVCECLPKLYVEPSFAWNGKYYASSIYISYISVCIIIK